jgi:hypothetical protein
MAKNILEVIDGISNDAVFTPLQNLEQIGWLARGFAPMLTEILQGYIQQSEADCCLPNSADRGCQKDARWVNAEHAPGKQICSYFPDPEKTPRTLEVLLRGTKWSWGGLLYSSVLSGDWVGYNLILKFALRRAPWTTSH